MIYTDNTITADEIIEFWYGSLPSHDSKIDSNKKKKWFRGGKEFDDEINQKYGKFMIDVLDNKKYDKWRNTSKGCLSLIIISDQFTRNVYRNTIKMFKYDNYAQELTLYAINNKYDEELYKLHPAYNTFLYMPLMHSEKYKHHELLKKKSLWMLNKLNKNNPFYGFINSQQKFVDEHADVIKQCGRFPQRNDILGRTTTEKEKEIIKKYDLMSLIDQSKKDKNKKK